VDDAIAIGVATADLACLHATPDAAMGFDCEVFEEQGVHGAFQAHMKLVDLTFGQGEDGDVCEAQALEHARHVFLIAANAVQRLGQHYLETARLRVGQKRLDAGADEGSAGDGAIRIALYQGPALARGALTALAQLVFDGGVALIVGGITGIEGNAGRRTCGTHGSILSIGIGPVLRVAGFQGPVVVGGGQPLEILTRHTPADDTGQRQGYVVDPAPRLGVRLALRAGIVVGRFEPLRPRFRVISHATACELLDSNRHEAASGEEPERKNKTGRP